MGFSGFVVKGRARFLIQIHVLGRRRATREAAGRNLPSRIAENDGRQPRTGQRW